jgi:hypothetical protein
MDLSKQDGGRAAADFSIRRCRGRYDLRNRFGSGLFQGNCCPLTNGKFAARELGNETIDIEICCFTSAYRR